VTTIERERDPDEPGPTEFVIEHPVIAAVAAHSASRVTGVSGLDPAQGVHVAGPGPVVAIDVLLSEQDQAAAVAGRLQRDITRAVVEATGVSLAAVSVSILDIQPAGPPR
jgi:uncharacterized alkaline shock family protein YloU